MKYQRFEQTIIVRMDKGEDIVEQVKNVALKEKNLKVILKLFRLREQSIQ